MAQRSHTARSQSTSASLGKNRRPIPSSSQALLRRRYGRGLEQLESRIHFSAVQWDGEGDGSHWSDPRNWSGDVLPQAGDDVTLPAAGGTVIADAVSLTLKSLNLNEALQATGSLSLAIANNVTIGSGGAIAVSGNLIVAGNMTLGGGTVSTTGSQSYNGSVSLTANTTLTSGGNIAFGGTVTGAYILAVNAGGTINSGGVIAVTTLALQAASGIGSHATPLPTQVGTLSAQAATGGIHISNTGDLAISGGVLPGVNGVRAGTTGDIELTNAGSISVTKNGKNIHGPANVTVTAIGGTSDIQTGGYQEAIENVGAGTVTLTAGRDVIIGLANSYADVNANQYGDGADASVVINAGRDIIVQGSGTSFVDAYGATGAVTATAARDIVLVANQGNIFTNKGGAITLTAGRNFLDGANNSISTTNNNPGGNIAITANDMDIQSSISAGSGQITISTYSAGRDAYFGDVSGAGLVLSQAELDRMSGATLRLHVSGMASLSNVSFAALDVSAAGGINLKGSITTTGDQTYETAVTLAGDTTLSGSAVTFNSTVDGGFNLTVAAGMTTFGGMVGETAPLDSLTTDAAGTTAINAALVHTTGAQNYGDAVTLGADTTLTGSAVTFNSTVDGGFNLAVNAATTTFGRAVGGIAPLNSLQTSGTTAINGGLVKTTGGQTYYGAVTLGAAASDFISMVNGMIVFAQTLDGASATRMTGRQTAFSGQVGGTVPLTSLTTGSMLTTAGLIQTQSFQDFKGNVTIYASTTFTSLSSGDVAFEQTLDGPLSHAPSITTVNTGGTTTFGGRVGGLAPLDGLTTDAAGTTAIKGGSVTTTGAQNYGDAVTLGADTTLSGSDVTFNGTVDGGFNLTVNAATTTFGAAVGSLQPLAGLTTKGAATINGSVTTSGSQDFKGAVTVSGATDTFTSANNGAITFEQTLDGPANVIVRTGGTRTFGGQVGGITPLIYLKADMFGTTTINGGLVETVGGQWYQNPVTLGAAASDFISTTGGSIEFDQTLDGASATRIEASALTAFVGPVGGTVPLTSLTTTGMMATLASLIQTQSFQDFKGTVLLLGATTFASSNNGDINFEQTVDGMPPKGDEAAVAEAITVNTGGTATFGGPVGGFGPLDSLTTDPAGTTAINGGWVLTTGAQNYGDAVTLGADTTLFGSAVTFNGTVTGAHTLAVNAADTINASGVIAVTTLALQTGNGIGSHDAPLLTQVSSLSAQATTGGVYISNTGDLAIGGDVLPGVDGVRAVTTGDVELTNAGSISITNVGWDALNIQGPGNVTVTAIGGASDIATGGNQEAIQNLGAGTVTVTAGRDVILGVAGGSFGDVNANANGNGADASVILNAARDIIVQGNGTSFLDANGATGTVTAVAARDIVLMAAYVFTSGGGITLAAGRNFVDGSAGEARVRTFGGNVAITADDMDIQSPIDAGSGQISISTSSAGQDAYFGDVSGAGLVLSQAELAQLQCAILSLNASGSASLSNVSFAALDVSAAAGINLAGSITTTGNQTYETAVTLAGDTTLSGSAVTFNSAVDGGFNLTANAATTTFRAAVGGLQPLAGLTTGAAMINGGSVTTSGAQNYGDAVTLGADTTLTGSAVTFNGTVDGGFNLAVNAATTTFGASVGGLQPLAGLTTGAAAINGGSVTTSGDQSYGDDVALGADASLTGQNITFGSSVDGDYALSVTVSQVATFNGDVGGNAWLTKLRVDGDAALNCSSVSTSAVQEFHGTLAFSQPLTLTASQAGLWGATDGGANDLTVNGTLCINDASLTAGAISVNGVGALWGAVKGASVSVSGATYLWADVTTTGNQTYSGPVLLCGSQKLTAALVSMPMGVSRASGAFGACNLALSNDGLFGPITNLGGLWVGGNATFNGPVTTSGDQIYDGNVQTADGITLSGSTITFNGRLSIAGDSATGTLNLNSANGVRFGNNSAWCVTLDPANDHYDRLVVETGSINLNGLSLQGNVLSRPKLGAPMQVITLLAGTDDGMFDEGTSLNWGAAGTYEVTTTASTLSLDRLSDHLATTVTVLPSATTPVYHDQVRFVATVAQSVEGGSVQFMVDGVAVGAPVTLSSNQAEFDTSALKAAKHTILAVYSGEGDFDGSNGATDVSVQPRTLTVSGDASDKVYDGTTAASVKLSDDRVAGDDVKLTYVSANFANKNVGDGKTITISGIALSGDNAGNYTIAADPILATASITPATLTVTAGGINKVYDGGTAAGVTFSDNRIVGDHVSVSGSAAFADKTVGDGKTITVSGVALSGDDAANYRLASRDVSATANITRAALTVTANGINKVYDGGTAAGVTLSNNRIVGDHVSVSGSAAFADKNVGGGKTITVSGLTLSGDDAGNYTVAADPIFATASITPATLTITADGINKVYDGGTAAGVTFSNNRIVGDDVNVNGSATFADKNVGDGKTITVSGLTLSGDDAGNYTIAADPILATASITPATLTITADGINKVYDGGTAAGVAFSNNRIVGDHVSVSGSATFADKNVGGGKIITVSGLTLSGDDAGNYTIAADPILATASITPATLTITADGINKVYDGGTAAGVAFSNNRIVGDDVSVSGSATFADKNVGSGKTITVSGLTLSGDDAGNYTVAADPIFATASITPATLTITADGINKVYDGTRAATVTFSDNRIGGDDLLVANDDAVFADKNAGSGKAVTVHGVRLSGTDAANYVLASGTLTTLASITPARLTPTVIIKSKTYDGTTAASIATRGLLGVFAGDAVSLAGGLATFGSSDPGANKLVTVSGLRLAGAGAGNYILSPSTLSTTGTITKAAVKPQWESLLRPAILGGRLVFTYPPLSSLGARNLVNWFAFFVRRFWRMG